MGARGYYKWETKEKPEEGFVVGIRRIWKEFVETLKGDAR